MVILRAGGSQAKVEVKFRDFSLFDIPACLHHHLHIIGVNIRIVTQHVFSGKGAQQFLLCLILINDLVVLNDGYAGDGVFHQVSETPFAFLKRHLCSTALNGFSQTPGHSLEQLLFFFKKYRHIPTVAGRIDDTHPDRPAVYPDTIRWQL